MRINKLAVLSVFVLFLSGCSAGISSSEKLACDALFEPWQKVDFYEVSNFKFLYSTYGVSRLGDNSETSTILGKNSQMAAALRQAMGEGDDEDLQQLVTQHSLRWTSASNDGTTLMRSLVFKAKMGGENLNDVQLNLMSNSSAKIIEAGNIAMKIRSRCIEIGYKQGS